MLGLVAWFQPFSLVCVFVLIIIIVYLKVTFHAYKVIVYSLLRVLLVVLYTYILPCHIAGDCVRIDEETLDRQHYIVTVIHTGDSGRVPKEFVTVGEFP